MTLAEYNPPAFPYAFHFPEVDGEPQGINLGMSLRDHFAGLAMQAMVSYGAFNEAHFDDCARRYYAMADAMLAARVKYAVKTPA